MAEVVKNQPIDFAETWADKYGETLSVAEAGRILGVSRWTIYKHINEGHFKGTIDGRIFTRSAAVWYETGIPQGIARFKSQSDNTSAMVCNYRIRP